MNKLFFTLLILASVLCSQIFGGTAFLASWHTGKNWWGCIQLSNITSSTIVANIKLYKYNGEEVMNRNFVIPPKHSIKFEYQDLYRMLNYQTTYGWGIIIGDKFGLIAHSWNSVTYERTQHWFTTPINNGKPF